MENILNLFTVYVGTYAKYSNGNLFGKWINLFTFDNKADFEAYCRKYHNEYDAELMFQDYNIDLPDFFINESFVSPDIWKLKPYLKDELFEAYLSFMENIKGEYCDYSEFKARYICIAKDEEDFAYSYAENSGEVSDFYRGYLNYKKLAESLFSSEYVFHDGYVFSNR